MAEHFTDQYERIHNTLTEGLLIPNDLGGNIRIAKFSFSNAGHIENDTVRLTRLPPNSTVLGVVISTDTLNAGDYDLGTDDNPILLASNISLQQDVDFLAEIASGVLTHFDTETDIVLRWRSATVSGMIKGYVMYN